MKLNFDDPKLTAYALGELEPAQAAQIDDLVSDAPDIEKEVEEIRRAAEFLRVGLGGELPANVPMAKKPDVVRLATRIRKWMPLAAAACLLIVGYSIVVPSFNTIKESVAPQWTPLANKQLQNPSISSPTTPINLRPPAPIVGSEAPSQSVLLSGSEKGLSNVDKEINDLDKAAKSRIVLGYGPLDPSQTTSKRGVDIYNPSYHAPSREPSSHFDVVGGTDLSNPTASEDGVVTSGRLYSASVGMAGGMTKMPSSPASLHRNRREVDNRVFWFDARPADTSQSNAESYDSIQDNPFLPVDQKNALSTFSIDVDTASYSNIRRMLQSGQRPPKGAVRIEELINYFTYDYPPPTDGKPFSVNVEIAQCPWQPEHRLARIGLKGKTFAEQERPACNLVFLIDVSGSMQPQNKLPLLKQAMGMLVNKLTAKDRVAMVVYAGSSGLVLDSTRGDDHATIVSALERLEAGGSTNGAGGIEQAYEVAARNKIDGVNRVILATDGDFNVGITSQSDLVDLIEKKAKSGIFLSVLGVGMGNLKDSTLEKLADKGNGNYAYIDSLAEARKVLVDQVGGTLVTIAKDVKIQVEFNPAVVQAYRLIGYENRILAAEDFNNDKKDAGEIGAGHTVTALYELVPVGARIVTASVDQLKYQPPPQAQTVAAAPNTGSSETMTIKLRYKQPDGDTSSLMEQPVVDTGLAFSSASADTRFAAAVAVFGMLLRDSPHKGSATYVLVSDLAGGAAVNDVNGYRAEFLSLVQRASQLPVAEQRP